jgi:hypothetical protein
MKLFKYFQLFTLVLLVACNPENPRRGGKKQTRGLQGLGTQAFQRMEFEISNFTLSDLRQPKDQEEIEYRVTYVKQRSATFNLDNDGTLCKFTYNKALIREVVSKAGNDFTISKTTIPTQTTYAGIPIADVKSRCEAARDQKLAGSATSRKLDLAKAWESYKAYLKGEVQNLVSACQSRAIIMGGKCRSMDAELTRDQEVLFEPIVVYKFGAKVEAARADYTVERIFSLNFAYFSYFGFIHSRGITPLEGQDVSKAIESLELLTWKR